MSETALIPLSQGRFAMVDMEDADLLNVKWSAAAGKTTFYAIRSIRTSGVRTSMSLHRVIASRMGISGHVDHANRHGLDCRRNNIRAATMSQNNSNRRRPRNNSSGYKGVSFRSQVGKWRASISVNRIRRDIGHFDNPADAARAYDAVARAVHGEFAVMNFPPQPTKGT